ncbi:MAG: hypothetical protein M3N82_02850 [Pseudomonadota bacterium]|nr:hypothetical protein [Pseudomonadota bacterium]
MRDFTNDGDIHVHGDMNVGDGNSNGRHYTLLRECSSEALLRERPHRQENYQLEQARKVQRLKPFYALSAILFVAAATLATINGRADVASLALGIGSIMLAYKSLEATLTPNAFQREEQDALAEISKLLRQRQVE